MPSAAAPHVPPSLDAPVRKVRWGLALAILILGSAGTATAWAFRGTTGFESLIAIGLGALTIFSLGVWLMFLSGLSRGVRFGVLGLAALVAFGLISSLRVDAVEGDMLPRLAWTWTPKAEDNLREYLKSTGAQPTASTAPAGTDEPAAPPEPTLAATDHDYPAYLNADRRGVVTNVKLARDWSAAPPKELWRHPIGFGWSGIAVVGDHAFTQEQREAEECVVCYDAATGAQKWVHADKTRFDEAMGGPGPRATPTVVNGRVYTMGATGLLNCLDGATGALVWQQKTLPDPSTQNITWAMAGSPLVYDDVVVVTPGAGKDPAPGNARELVAYRAADGAPAWSAGDDRTSYSSPQLSTVLGGKQLLNLSAKGLSGNDPADGRRLWFVEWKTGPDLINPTQPVSLVDWGLTDAVGEIFLSTGYVHGCTLIKVKEQEGKFTASKLWENQNLKSKFANYVIRDHYVYGLDEGFLVCLDLKEGGKSLWKKNRKQQYKHGQLLLVDDLLLIQAEDGYVALVAADPSKFEELGRFDALSSKTWNTLALAGNRLFVRNDREAACFELPLAK